MKALITGSEGFVGKYLRRELEVHGYAVTGLDRNPGKNVLDVDLRDAQAVASAVAAVQPDAVVHLAGQANVALSWAQPADTFEINTICALHLMDALRLHAPDARLLLVGSSDQYGNLGAAGQNVTEDISPQPQTPYAISKQAQEQLGLAYARAYNLHICAARAFNHVGAGQRLGFIVPDFAAGIAGVELGQRAQLTVGNLETGRDFTHVRDVVRAYRLILERGRMGTVYNVGSGTVHSVREILDALTAMARRPIPVQVDPARLRPSDTPVLRCNHDRLTLDTGWQPEIPLQAALQEVLDEWRNKLRNRELSEDI